MSCEPPALDPDTHRAAMIARAACRRETLEELTRVGMALSKEIAIRMIDGPYHPELRHDPGRSFAAVSRAVRLTLVLEAKVDRQILALCNGDVAPAETSTSTRAVSNAGTQTFARRVSDRESLVESERADPQEVTDVPPSPSWGGSSREATGVGKCGSPATFRDDLGSPTPDFASLRLDPPHFGGGRLVHEGDDIPGDLAVPPPRSRPDSGSRPLHFGGGRMWKNPSL